MVRTGQEDRPGQGRAIPSPNTAAPLLRLDFCSLSSPCWLPNLLLVSPLHDLALSSDIVHSFCSTICSPLDRNSSSSLVTLPEPPPLPPLLLPSEVESNTVATLLVHHIDQVYPSSALHWNTVDRGDWIFSPLFFASGPSLTWSSIFFWASS